MNEASRKSIEKYIKTEVVCTGTLSEIRDLLLFFCIVQHRNHPTLASIVTDIRDINGFEQAEEGISSLHRLLSRRWHFKKLLPSIHPKNNFNINDAQVINSLIDQLISALCVSTQQLKSIFNLKIISRHPGLLSKLLKSLKKKNKIYNKGKLNFTEINYLINDYLTKHRLIANGALLTDEFHQHQETLDILFSSKIEKEDIENERDYFNCISKANFIKNHIEATRDCKFIQKGSKSHLPPGVYVGIINSLLFIALNVAMGALLAWLIPLTMIAGSQIAVLSIGAIPSIVMVLLSIFFQFYLTHHFEKNEKIRQRELTLELASDISSYREVLQRSNYNLSELNSQRFFRERTTIQQNITPVILQCQIDTPSSNLTPNSGIFSAA